MSYGVALRNGVPFTLGTIAALCTNATGSAWSPLALWPDGISSAGMWISPRTLDSQWQDYTGTTPVATPGTVADASNPVGLALDIRAGATVLTDPGNHMLQSTSAARPLMSARRNTLTYTEDFSNGVWATDLMGDATLTKTLSQTDPLGNATAVRILTAMTTGESGFRYTDGLATEQVIRSAYIKSNTGVGYSMYLGDTVITLTADTEWHRYDVSESWFTWGFRVQFTSAADITLAFPQRELGTSATPYQSVPGNGSTYATDFPIFQLYDGVDDGMATASFTAGTLTSAMDCMIAVRRDGNNHQSLGGLYQTDETKYFGVIGTDPGTSAGTHNGCGTPTIFVDGVEVANTRGALYDAIGLGGWHILEYRGLDMSAWVDAGFGYYASGYQFIGPRGDILLYPSTASTEDKDNARQYLADYYGVTLP